MTTPAGRRGRGRVASARKRKDSESEEEEVSEDEEEEELSEFGSDQSDVSDSKIKISICIKTLNNLILQDERPKNSKKPTTPAKNSKANNKSKPAGKGMYSS